MELSDCDSTVFIVHLYYNSRWNEIIESLFPPMVYWEELHLLPDEVVYLGEL